MKRGEKFWSRSFKCLCNCLVFTTFLLHVEQCMIKFLKKICLHSLCQTLCVCDGGGCSLHITQRTSCFYETPTHQQY